MASVATTRLRLDKQATGDNPNAWGIRLNAALDLIDESQGVSIVPVTADVTLTSNNYTSDQSRRAVLRFTGAGGFTVTVPAVEKLYLIDNRCAADVTLKTASGVSAVIRAGTRVPAYVDAVDTAAVDPTLDKIKPPVAAVAMNGQKLTGLTPGTTLGDAITYEQSIGYSDAAAASATLAMNWAMSLTLVDATYFGARKYAIDAFNSAAAAATFDPSSYYTKTASDARYGTAGGASRSLRVARLYNVSTFP